MTKGSISLIIRFFLVSLMMLVLMGTKACQEDYELGVQTTTPSPTPDENDEEDDDDDDDDDDLFPSPSPTMTPSPSPSPIPDPSPSPSPTPTVSASMLRSQSANSDSARPERDRESSVESLFREVAAIYEERSLEGENWLGEAYNSPDSEGEESLGKGRDVFTTFEEHINNYYFSKEEKIPLALIETRSPLFSQVPLSYFPRIQLAQENFPDNINVFFLDADRDTLSDFEEILLGFDPLSFELHDESTISELESLLDESL